MIESGQNLGYESMYSLLLCMNYMLAICLPQISYCIFVFPCLYVTILMFVIIPFHALFHLPEIFSGPCLWLLQFQAYAQMSPQSNLVPNFQPSSIYVSDKWVSVSCACASVQVCLKEEQETISISVQ